MTTGLKTIKRIAIYEPRSTHVHVYSAFSTPRLGGIMLATILKKAGYEATVYSEEVGEVSMEALQQADLVGISMITPTTPRGYAAGDKLRLAGVPVVIGGIHATFCPDESMQHADFVVRGEGEAAFPELLRALENNGDLSAIQGLSYRQNGTVTHNPERPFATDLDELPFPDYSVLFRKMRYPMVSVMTSRGCPHDCSFCSVPNYLGRRYRKMSVDRVLDEIRYQQSYHGKLRYMFFADDIFNLDRERAKAILEGLLKLDHIPPWGAQMRHEAARDPELLDLMRRTKCDRVFVGFESINPETLTLFNKKENVSDIKDAVAAFHRHRLRVHGMFVVGSDKDSVETIQDTKRLARKWGIDTVQLLVLTPIPGSRDFAGYENDKRIIARDWGLYDGHHAVFAPRGMTPYELEHETMVAMGRFYDAKSVLRKLVRTDISEAAVLFSARKLIRTWRRRNEGRLEKLRTEQGIWAEYLTGVSRAKASLRAIGVIQAGDTQFLRFVEAFFGELGIRIEAMGKDLHEFFADLPSLVGGTDDAGRKQRPRGLAALSKKVSYLILPVDHASGDKGTSRCEEVQEMSRRSASSVPEPVPVVAVPADLTHPTLRQKLTACALAFTDDMEAIRRAYRKALIAAA